MGIFKSKNSKNKDKTTFKLEGDELAKELERVKQESSEFKGEKVEIQDKKEKPKKLTQFKYVVKASNGEKIKGVFDAETQDDVRIFLVNGGYEIVSIAPVSKLELNINIGSNKIKNNDLAFMLTQLSTYVKAGIPLIDSVRISSKQTTKANYRRILDKVVYELIMGEKFSSALEKQGNVFPKLLINMVKTSEMTGDLSGTLDEMADYYTEMEKTRKQMISAMVYPAVILVLAIAAIIFIVVTVVPQFIEMFRSNNAKLPGITLFIINASNFLTQKWYIIAIILLVVLIVYRTLYKNVKGFRKAMQTIFMKTPVIGNVIIYNEVANFTRTFASLLNHNVFITDSMDVLSKITDNEIYKRLIFDTARNLTKGEAISKAFKDHWAFPNIAYQMLITGEKTGRLGPMMERVSNYYQEQHRAIINQMKSLIEPVMIVTLAVIVGGILLAVIIPMYGMYDAL